MPLHAVGALLCVFALAVVARATVPFSPAGWGITAIFPAAPTEEELRFPSPYGDEVAQRNTVESGDEKFVLTRISYPVFPTGAQRPELIRQAIESFMNSRAGVIREDETFVTGAYTGKRLLIEHRRENSHREVRLLLVGGSLYFASAEWSGGRTPSAIATEFLNSLAVPAELSNPAVAEEKDRWREIAQGNFVVRFDSSRWYRDPGSTAGGTEPVFLLRVDQLAEAEFSTGPQLEAASMEQVVIAAAKETADRVTVRKRGKRLQGSKSVEELRFSVRAEGETYENHGYFYNGTEGSVQLRAWSPQATFAEVEGDILELLDSLQVRPGSALAAVR